jgi:nucleoside-diphosphate-sugar epimerase
MIAAVTGGTGFIGRHLVNSLIAKGIHVRLLTRRPKILKTLWPKGFVEPWGGDLTKPESLRGFVHNARIVYHLAGETRDAKTFNMVNVTGTKNLMETCYEQKITSFVHLSSTGVFTANGANVVDENTPCHPRNAYGRSKYAGEQIVFSLSKKLHIPVTVIRPPNVFGEERSQTGDVWLSWLTAIQKGRFRFIGTGDPVANYIYVGDLVLACLLVAESDKTVGKVYVVSDPCSMRDFVGAAAEFLGVKMPGNIPSLLAYILAGGFEIAGRVAHFSPPLTLDLVRALTNRSVYKGEKIRKELGFTPLVGWREGLRRTIAWYRQNKLLPLM